MKKLSLILLFTGSFIFIFPCGWDWDTIQMEKQEFPTVHELMVGKFLRHSPELYYWRIRNRTDLIKKYPDSLHYYDDLAMAYDKTGDSKKAIEIMHQKEKKKAGLYETWANLGLFYMHNGQMQEGVDAVKKALKINPDAHFGRERYQLYLGEYILSKMKDGKLELPLAKKGERNFYDYVNDKYMKGKIGEGSTKDKELAKAIKGVAGMMTFANFKSPVLLEALGDLLMKTNSVGGAGHLASRAYLRASFEIKEKGISKKYVEKAKLSIEKTYGSFEGYGRPGEDSLSYMSNPETSGPLYRVDQLEVALMLEIQSANVWYDSICKNEFRWIQTGKNPDSMFALTYYDNPKEVIPVHENSAVKRKDEIDEIFWMRNQLDAPDFIRNIHGYDVLSDSIKTMLDAIYDQEFGQAPNENLECGLASSKRQEREEKEENKKNGKWQFSLIFWIGLVILACTIGFIFFRIKHRRK